MSTAEDNGSGGVGFDNYDPEDMDKVGGIIDKPGQYHLEVNKVEVSTDIEKDRRDGSGTFPVSQQVALTMNVCKTVEGQSPEGSRLYHHFDISGKGGGPMEDWQKNVLARTLRAFGIIKVVDGRVVDSVSGKSVVTNDRYGDMQDMQIIATVKENRYTPKNGPNAGKEQIEFKVPFGEFYSVDDPKVADVPKDADRLAVIGKVVQGSDSGAAAGGDGFGDDF